jgi:Flp pilus assembly protein TadD
MSRISSSNRVLGIAVTSALTGVLLSGCMTAKAEPANVAASRAVGALVAGKAEQAVRHAEAAVEAEPHNAAYRATLGSAYLDSGRFASAATTFRDAMQLGDSSPRTVLSLALALTGEGRLTEAAALLSDHESQIATADLGLALALAGEPGRGIHLMGNAIRGGENTAKMRQNLAFAYALAGRWREARLMAEQDVPANQVPDRIEQWAMLAQPGASQQRVAGLLDVPAGVADAGQPIALALANNPSIEQLAAEAAPPAELPALAVAETPVPTIELPPVAAEPAPPRDFAAAFASAAQSRAVAQTVAQDSARFAEPVARSEPVRASTPAPAAARVARQDDGTHLVQLGSFSTEQGARRAWTIYQNRYPELAGHRMVISEAVVHGKHYWRVSAAGFAQSGATAMCGKVKSSGEGCFAYAEGRPLPGAIDTGTRLARR